MPDIEMCNAVTEDGQVCLVSHECYRHTAKPSFLQAWGPPGPDFMSKDGCDNYWPNGDKRILDETDGNR